MISLEEALRRVLTDLHPLESEGIPISQAQGRIAAESILSPMEVPPFDNSAMDGYAVRSEDVQNASPSQPRTLQIVGRLAAGSDSQFTLGAGQAVRVFTGSPVPPGSDAVVMQEDTQPLPSDPNAVLVLDAAKPFENMRLRGEDIKKAALLVAKGSVLGFAQLGVIAAVGLDQVRVIAKPLVGIVATGSELREPGTPLLPGQIYESNRIAIASLLRSCGVDAKIYPLVPDSLEETQRSLALACDECDVVLTTGGVSVGDYDYVKDAFTRIGGVIDVWRIAVKPGKPFVFGCRKAVPLFGLPGNPVSAAVAFQLLVRPALARLRGILNWHPRTLRGLTGEPLRNAADRRHFMRVCQRSDGTIASAGPQGSHVLSSLCTSIGLLDMPPQSLIPAGAAVEVITWE